MSSGNSFKQKVHRKSNPIGKEICKIHPHALILDIKLIVNICLVIGDDMISTNTINTINSIIVKTLRTVKRVLYFSFTIKALSCKCLCQMALEINHYEVSSNIVLQFACTPRPHCINEYF